MLPKYASTPPQLHMSIQEQDRVKEVGKLFEADPLRKDLSATDYNLLRQYVNWQSQMRIWTRHVAQRLGVDDG